jgi:hypothetical protein
MGLFPQRFSYLPHAVTAIPAFLLAAGKSTAGSQKLFFLSAATYSRNLCRKATFGCFSCGNGLPIAKPPSKGGCAWPADSNPHAQTYREALAPRASHGSGHTQKRDQ